MVLMLDTMTPSQVLSGPIALLFSQECQPAVMVKAMTLMYPPGCKGLTTAEAQETECSVLTSRIQAKIGKTRRGDEQWHQGRSYRNAGKCIERNAWHALRSERKREKKARLLISS